MPRKYLIAMLSSNGDCVMVTTLANQLKHDEPTCHITWVIGYKCKQVIENNPHVDMIWEVQYDANENIWEKVKAEAALRKTNGEFDEIFYCPIFPDFRERFDGTTRSSTFRSFTRAINVPITPVMRLYGNEVENVKKFVETYGVLKYKHVILCECAPSSAQSFLNPEKMMEVAKLITKVRKDILFIFSTHLKLNIEHNQIIDASILSYRENAELSKYCSLLVGCSSGLTWLLTSDWAKKIPTVQFLNKSKEKPLNFASVKYDFNYYGLATDHIIESSNSHVYSMANIITGALDNFNVAKNEYDENLIPHDKMFRLYLTDIIRFKTFFQTIKKSTIFYSNFKHRNQKGIIFSILFPFYLIEAITKRFVFELKIAMTKTKK